MNDVRLVHVVDDDDDVRHSLRALLEAYEFAVHDYESARFFLAKAVLSRPSCVLADVNMPDMGGLELLSRMRAHNLTMPAILFSGRVDGTLRERGTQLGALAVLEKPVDDETLLLVIEGALDLDRQRAQAVGDR